MIAWECRIHGDDCYGCVYEITREIEEDQDDD